MDSVEKEYVREVASLYAQFLKQWSEVFHNWTVKVLEQPEPIDTSRNIQMLDMASELEDLLSSLRDQLHYSSLAAMDKNNKIDDESQETNPPYHIYS